MKQYYLKLLLIPLFTLSMQLYAQTPSTMEFGTSTTVIVNALNPSADQSTNPLLNGFDVSMTSSNSRIIAFALSGNGAGTNSTAGGAEASLFFGGDSSGTTNSSTLSTDSGGEIGITSFDFAYEYNSGASTLSFTASGKKNGIEVGTKLINVGHNTLINVDLTNPTTGSFLDIDELVLTPSSPFIGGWSLDTIIITAAVSNTAPLIAGTSAGQVVNDNATILPFSAITTTDADGDNLSATITLDDNAKGVLSGTGLTGTGPYAIASTTPADLQAKLRVLSYDPTDNRTSTSETTTFTVVINDGTDTDTDTATTVISSAVSPIVSSVAVPANGTYALGQNLDFTVNFNENITAVTTGGTPQIAITIGATVNQAAYISGSGSSTLLFRYTVQSGDLDTDGIAIGTLATNGGTLADSGNANANTTLNSVGATTNVLVSTCTAPTIPSVTYAPGIICDGNSALISISGTLNDAIQWHVYTGSCGGTLVATTTSSSAIVTPPVGTTTYYIRGEGGCVTPSTCGTVTITTTTREDASFSYNASAYCADEADPTPTITGVSGGTFSSAAGLSINSNTGTIDLSASTPNTYMVRYETPGLCSATKTTSITVNAIDDASFSYGAGNYTTNDSDPTPTITGLGGGTFSSTAGLSINAATGTIDVSASTANTYTITYTTTGSCPNSSNVSVTITSSNVTWTGSTSNDWATALNWNTNTVPSTNADIIIPSGLNNYPTANVAVTFNSLTINSGATFKPNSTVTGPVTYKRNLPNTNWYLVAAPVNGETQQDVIASHTFANGTGSNIGLGGYLNNTGPSWIYSTAASTGAIPSGVGISMKLTVPGDVSITGSINTSNVSFPVNQGTRDNFNLLGNPYTSYINSAAFTTTNTTVLTEETIWLWDGTQYVTYNAVSPIEIAPAQGFFVEASTNNTVLYSTSNRSHQNTDTFMRQTPKTSFELFVENDASKKSTKVFYVANKTTGFDNGYDSKIFSGVKEDFTIYTELLENNKGKKLAIQTLPNTNLETMVIPIGLTTEAGKELTFSVSSKNLPEGMDVYLEDRIANTFTNLSQGNYKITVKNTSKSTGQFYIHTTSKKLENIPTTQELQNVSIYRSTNNTLTVAGLQTDNASLNIYSILGKKIISTQFKSTGVHIIKLPETSKGVYIVELKSDLGKISKKIILE
ncbi:T9SS type A sorting domain-containing protein [Tenacibaculum sp. AHE15PA]|uniref:T9SS type A sorting domain-containing protein n=1 Tax=unclassified Tenacibaculum TaxID=2635139 RepID=UPI001C4FF3DE|nr:MULTISPECIES: T9SS type A sorting domain-containing protein [unclassified Tenacibaculum]QXP72501.1 T9SS type A sorting domain-containing protein [Tenacibaculum sp. AHE14PA]QXP76417.1 T9SS type A sorting domain-containing protein [Tenacibaculum sp. AHE15PA]